MKNKIYQSYAAAVADVPDGSVFMSPGFSGVGIPRNLLARSAPAGGQGIDRHLQQYRRAGGRVDVGTLVAAGQVKKMYAAFTAPTHPSQITPFVRMYNEGEIDAELVPQGTMPSEFAPPPPASAPFIPRPASAPNWPRARSTGRLTAAPTFWSTPPPRRLCLYPSVAGRYFRQLAVPFVPAKLQPDYGNGSPHYGGRSGRRNCPVGELDPDKIHVPGVYVNRIVKMGPDDIWD